MMYCKGANTAYQAQSRGLNLPKQKVNTFLLLVETIRLLFNSIWESQHFPPIGGNNKASVSVQ